MLAASTRSLLCTLVLLSLAATGLHAQAAAATVPVAGSERFLGEWTVSANGDAGPVTVVVTLTNSSGNFAAKVTGSTEAEGRTVQRVARTADGALAITYTLTVQGQAVPTVLTLTPEGAAMKAKIDLAGGMMVLNGDAKKTP